MKILLLISALFYLVNTSAQAPILNWANRIGDSANDEGYGIVEDSNGNVYITGIYENYTVDFDPGPNFEGSSNQGGNDCFILKLDEFGNYVWAKTFGGSGDEESYAIAINHDGDVIVTGNFEGTVDFDPNSGTQFITATSTSDVFVLCLDSNGNFNWVSTYGGGPSTSNALVIDNDNNPIITGHFWGTIDFDPNSGIDTLQTSSAFTDLFVIKMDPNGQTLWAKSINGPQHVLGEGICVDPLNDILLTGTFMDSADFDPGLNAVYRSVVGDRDIFILKLDPNGDFIWVKTMGGSDSNARGYSITTDTIGNIYSTGRFFDTVDFDPGINTFNLSTPNSNSSSYVQKLNQNGDFIWAKATQGLSYDVARSIHVNNEGDCYVGGLFKGTVDFDPGNGLFNLVSNSNTSTFIQKLDSSGNFLWAVPFLSNSNTTFGTGRNCIWINEFGNVFLTGKFRQTVDFDPQNGTYDLSSDSPNTYDAYMLKLFECQPLSSTQTETACFSYTWPVNGATYTASNTYSSVLTTSNGCDSTVYLDLEITSVDNSVSLSNFTLTANMSGATYQWLDCNNANAPIAGATNQDYSPLENGSYAVEVTYNNCTLTSDCITVSGLAISENEPIFPVNVYPNPSSGWITVEFNNLKTIQQINIKTVNGRLVKSYSTNGDNTFFIPLPDTNGIYLVEFVGNDYYVVKKIVNQK